jgi:hypothetical protein
MFLVTLVTWNLPLDSTHSSYGIYAQNNNNTGSENITKNLSNNNNSKSLTNTTDSSSSIEMEMKRLLSSDEPVDIATLGYV